MAVSSREEVRGLETILWEIASLIVAFIGVFIGSLIVSKLFGE
jgi:hypothetical protein